jgi:hypothetical protein
VIPEAGEAAFFLRFLETRSFARSDLFAAFFQRVFVFALAFA